MCVPGSALAWRTCLLQPHSQRTSSAGTTADKVSAIMCSLQSPRNKTERPFAWRSILYVLMDVPLYMTFHTYITNDTQLYTIFYTYTSMNNEGMRLIFLGGAIRAREVGPRCFLEVLRQESQTDLSSSPEQSLLAGPVPSGVSPDNVRPVQVGGSWTAESIVRQRPCVVERTPTVPHPSKLHAIACGVSNSVP